MMFEAEGKQQIMALLKLTEHDVEPNTNVPLKRFGETELANGKYCSTVFWNKNQIEAQFTLISINEIVDALVMHKIAPKLNILS